MLLISQDAIGNIYGTLKGLDPSEYTSFQDIVNGANVLANTVYLASNQ